MERAAETSDALLSQLDAALKAAQEEARQYRLQLQEAKVDSDQEIGVVACCVVCLSLQSGLMHVGGSR